MWIYVQKEENLKKIREKKKITQVRLSIAAEVSQETISAYESGKAFPSVETLIKIADFLGTSTDYLLGKDMIIVNDEKEFEIVTNHFKQDINDDVINEVIKLLEELNEKDKNKIAKIIKDTIELLK